jgi:hypothetical protein
MRIRHYLAWACVVACGALGTRALIDRPEPPRVVTVTAPPTVIAIAVPAPPPLAPPPPQPPAQPSPASTRCGDVTTIGVPVALGTPIDEDARYALTGDKFWGCGGSDKLLELATGKELIGDLRADVWPISVHSTHGVAFAGLSNQLYRLSGVTATKIDDLNDGEVVGVDAAGTPIIRTGGQLLRWSRAGGWRVLLDATP